jgi:hypothetical protein
MARRQGLPHVLDDARCEDALAVYYDQSTAVHATSRHPGGFLSPHPRNHATTRRVPLPPHAPMGVVMGSHRYLDVPVRDLTVSTYWRAS